LAVRLVAPILVAQPLDTTSGDFWEVADMKERILVVDDQNDVADALVRLLVTLGYDAKAIYDGRQAVDQAAEFLPDMLFIDIGMPGFDGYQTVSRIRGHRECAHAIFVAVTGWTTNEDRQHAYANGFDLHVAKPMNMESLQGLLNLLDPSETESTAARIRDFSSTSKQAAQAAGGGNRQ